MEAAILAWVASHLGLSMALVGAICGFLASLLDLVFALKPEWESNGVLHAVYLWLKKEAPKKDA